MNKIFKVIWNPATGSYNVASETAKSVAKRAGAVSCQFLPWLQVGCYRHLGHWLITTRGSQVDYGNGSAGDRLGCYR